MVSNYENKYMLDILWKSLIVCGMPPSPSTKQDSEACF